MNSLFLWETFYEWNIVAKQNLEITMELVYLQVIPVVYVKFMYYNKTYIHSIARSESHSYNYFEALRKLVNGQKLPDTPQK